MHQVTYYTGFSWRDLPGKQTKGSICIRVTTFILGLISIIVSICLLDQIGVVAGWSIVSASILLIIAAIAIKRTKTQSLIGVLTQIAANLFKPAPSANFPSENSFIEDVESANSSIDTNLPKILVFQGGGPKIYLYIGALKALEETNILQTVKIVAGTSSGAVFATLLALGYTSHEIKKNLIKASEVEIRDGTGEAFYHWISSIIKEKTSNENFTFGQLRTAIKAGKHLKHLHIFAQNSHNALKDITGLNSVEDFNSQNGKYDYVTIAAALTASVSIPILFRGISLYHNKNSGLINCKFSHLKSKDTFVGTFSDCGVSNRWNLPIHVFDINRYSKGTLADGENAEDFVYNTRLLGFSPCNSWEMQKKDQRIVKIDALGMDVLHWYEIPLAELPLKIEQMILSGYTSTQKFLQERDPSKS